MYICMHACNRAKVSLFYLAEAIFGFCPQPWEVLWEGTQSCSIKSRSKCPHVTACCWFLLNCLLASFFNCWPWRNFSMFFVFKIKPPCNMRSGLLCVRTASFKARRERKVPTRHNYVAVPESLITISPCC